MLFRSPILALVGTASSVGTLVFWVVLMHAAGISWWWSALPIPAVLLIATWRRAPDWMLERTSWAARWRLGSVLVIPAASLAAAVILVRLVEIPRVEPGFNVDEYLRPLSAEQQETLRLYQRAEARFRGTAPASSSPSNTSDPPATKAESPLEEQRRWVSENQETIALLLEASRRPPCGMWDPAYGRTRLAGAPFLGDILLHSAAVRMADGQLDEAWGRYIATLQLANGYRIRGSDATWRQGDAIEARVYDQLPAWAVHPQQTPDRIQAAIGELEDLSRDAPSATSIIKDAYVEAVQPLNGDFRRLDSYELKALRLQRLTFALMPWETARARRLASFVAGRQLPRLEALEEAIRRGDPTTRRHGGGISSSDPRWHDRQQFESWWDTTPWNLIGFWELSWTVWLDNRVLEQEMYRRVVRIQLALLAWRKEHGQFPQRLDDLVGPYFQQLPLDPSCGQPFRYQPQGWPRDTRWLPFAKFYRSGAVMSLEELIVAVPAGSPFLWSPGDEAALAESQHGEPPTMTLADGSQVYSGYLFLVDP
jgi:hypothetical protein